MFSALPGRGGDLPPQPPYFKDVQTAEFWLRRLAQPERLIMSGEQIVCFNQEIRKRHPQVIRDLAAHQEELPGVCIEEMLKEREFPSKPLYHQGQPLEQPFFDSLLQEMNLQGLESVCKMKYAYSIRSTSVRSFPSDLFITDDPADQEFDLFQETSLDPAEPLVILHESRSKRWIFAQSSFCRGWISARRLAVAASRRIWLAYLHEERLLTVTGSRLRLGYNPYSPGISELEFKMGARIPLAAREEIPEAIDNQSPIGCYVVKLPVHDSLGELTFKPALVPSAGDVSIGYLPYTRGAVIRQAFKMHGERYGWGGLFNSRDCSAFVRDIYRCFGFQFPRNSREQGLLPGNSFSPAGASRRRRQRLLEQIGTGAILFFPGHVMVYLGKHRDEYYVIHAIAYFGDQEKGDADGGCLPAPLNAVTVSPLSLRRRSGEELLMALAALIEIESADCISGS
jgi:hypothetical protein